MKISRYNPFNLKLARYRPFSLMDSMFENMDRLMSNSFGFPYPTSTITDISVKETENEHVIRAEVPGFTEDQISIEVSNNVLCVKGEANVEKEEDGFCSSSIQSFHRSWALESGVKPEEIEAKLKNGILVIKVPKAKQLEEEGKVYIPVLKE